jgi:broad specificity phosphatase PhoE
MVNHLSGRERLANRYSVMRHGQSKANVAGVIVSSIDRDRGGDFGLSDLGREQSRAAAAGSGLPADTLICSSDFSRAQQTAEIVRDCLGAPDVIVAPQLRERYFGDWDGSGTANYARVWAADQAETGQQDADDGDGAPRSEDHGVESAAAVLDRATAFVADLERRFSGHDILLVSHGDTSQILQAGFLLMDPSAHRRVPHLDTAEIRPLRLGSGP